MKCWFLGHHWLNSHSIAVEWVIHGEHKHVTSHLFTCAKCGQLKKPKKIGKDARVIESLYEQE